MRRARSRSVEFCERPTCYLLAHFLTLSSTPVELLVLLKLASFYIHIYLAPQLL